MAPQTTVAPAVVVLTHAINPVVSFKKGAPLPLRPGRRTPAPAEAKLVEEATTILVRGLIEDAEQIARRESLRDFFNANHSKALVFACAALKDRDAAEDVVSKTYVELLEGRTVPKYFFRALKSNILDCQRRMIREQETFEPTEKTFDPRHAPGEDIMAGGESDEFSLEPSSPRPEDRDPLDILIGREEAAASERELARAREIAENDRRFWWIRQKKWGKQLGIGAVQEPSLSTN